GADVAGRGARGGGAGAGDVQAAPGLPHRPPGVQGEARAALRRRGDLRRAGRGGRVVRLSTDDLDVFFEDRHRALAGELGAAAPAIEAAERGAPDADGRARAVAAEMGRLGLYRWLLPESGSVDVRALCLVREMLGQVSPLGDAIFAVQGLGSYPLLIAGSGEQRALGDALRAGEAIAAFALTEPGAGSDVASIATSARRDGDGWVLEGEK